MIETGHEEESIGTVQRVTDKVLSGGTEGEHLVHRRFSRVLGYTILTVGIYGLYWLYSVNKQLKWEYGEEYNPMIRTIGVLVPVYNILVLWRISHTTADHVVEDQSGPVMFLLWIVFFPAAMYLIQDGINQQVALAGR